MRVIRFPTNPIITPEMDSRIGANINGPSLLRVPDWLPDPLGRYYLYFGHHQGEFIRLAYADDLAGPWTVYAPGTLALDETPCHGHIASPDVHVDDANRRIVMYYHGPALSREQQDGDPLTQAYPFLGGQRTLSPRPRTVSTSRRSARCWVRATSAPFATVVGSTRWGCRGSSSARGMGLPASSVGRSSSGGISGTPPSKWTATR
ncbi:MAG: hypothetical protein R2873_18115 [Caldilineaceae bacterium]